MNGLYIVRRDNPEINCQVSCNMVPSYDTLMHNSKLLQGFLIFSQNYHQERTRLIDLKLPASGTGSISAIPQQNKTVFTSQKCVTTSTARKGYESRENRGAIPSCVTVTGKSSPRWLQEFLVLQILRLVAFEEF